MLNVCKINGYGVFYLLGTVLGTGIVADSQDNLFKASTVVSSFNKNKLI